MPYYASMDATFWRHVLTVLSHILTRLGVR